MNPKKMISLLLTVCLVLSVLPAASFAAEEHKHEICEGITCTDANHANHGEVVWQEWDATSDITADGYYYATRNTPITQGSYGGDLYGTTVFIMADVTATVCLNGMEIIHGRDDPATFILEEGATLNLCDCTGSGSITSTGGSYHYTGILMSANSTLNFYNGSITTTMGMLGNASGVEIPATASGATFNMYGGEIFWNQMEPSVYAGAGSVNLYGGEISDGSLYGYGQTTDHAGGIELTDNATLRIGGNVTITGNTSSTNAPCNVYLPAGKTITSLGKLTGSVGVTVENGDPAVAPVPFITGVSGDEDIQNYFWDADNTVGRFVPDGSTTGYFGDGVTVSASTSPANAGQITGTGTYLPGSTVTVKVTPNSNYTFLRWEANGTEVSTSAEYSFTASADTTLVAVLEEDISALLPRIIAPTQDDTFFSPVGFTALAEIIAENADTYQWYVNRNDGSGFVKIDSATQASYETAPLVLENDGYKYYCVVSNQHGSVTSPILTLRVSPSEGGGEGDIPATGDGMELFVFTGLAAIALLGMAGLRKREQN